MKILYAKLESNSEPERARMSQRVANRASWSQSVSHKEPERARGGQKEQESKLDRFTTNFPFD